MELVLLKYKKIGKKDIKCKNAHSKILLINLVVLSCSFIRIIEDISRRS